MVPNPLPHLRRTHLFINDQGVIGLQHLGLSLTPNERRILDALNFLDITLWDKDELHRFVPPFASKALQKSISTLHAYPVTQLTALTQMPAQSIHAALKALSVRELVSVELDHDGGPLLDVAGGQLWRLSRGGDATGDKMRSEYKGVINKVLKRTYKNLENVPPVKITRVSNDSIKKIKSGKEYLLWDLLEILANTGEQHRDAELHDRIRPLQLKDPQKVVQRPAVRPKRDNTHAFHHLRRVHLWINDQIQLYLDELAIIATPNERRVLDALSFLHSEMDSTSHQKSFFPPLSGTATKKLITTVDAFPVSHLSELNQLRPQTIQSSLSTLRRRGLVKVDLKWKGPAGSQLWKLTDSGEAMRGHYNTAIDVILDRTYCQLSNVTGTVAGGESVGISPKEQTLLQLLGDVAAAGERQRDTMLREKIRPLQLHKPKAKP